MAEPQDPKEKKTKHQKLLEELPAVQNSRGTLLTDCILLGDKDVSYDGTFLKQNKVTHIVNCTSKTVHNIFENK